MAANNALPSEEPFVPDMERRMLMNYILLGSLVGSIGPLGYGFISFFIPPIQSGGDGGVDALDANGDVIKLTAWKANH